MKQLSSGKCLVLEISQPELSGEEVVMKLRELVGPSDPGLARNLRPHTLRAKYGKNTREENAIHCTDLPEDGKLEVEYFFKILQ